jgi:ubiquinone/menaquinone biosynthesis C-methylase UbiE
MMMARQTTRGATQWTLVVSLLLLAGETLAFSPQHNIHARAISSTSTTRIDLSSSTSTNPTSSPKAPPRTGFAQTLLNFALASPLWKLVLVPQARANIVNTAEANGIPWKECKEWIQANAEMVEVDNIKVPDYYRQAFHAYETGNLSWDAAWEVEIASAAIGARNFPQYGSKGEDGFRGAFESALTDAGASVPTGAKVLDLGCGSGMSTRRLAKDFPQVETIQGVDLSPYYIHIGKELLKLAPKRFDEGGPWVSTITPDDRIQYQVGDAAQTGLESESFDVVNLQFVLHELPADAARDIVDEALRLLKPNGQLWVCEMDFEAPAYAEQRANALLFSLIRSTEPYLDDYADSIASLFQYVQSKFHATVVVPATGRHYAMVANKGKTAESSTTSGGGVLSDMRFNEDGTYRVEDTHLKVWESKQDMQ